MTICSQGRLSDTACIAASVPLGQSTNNLASTQLAFHITRKRHGCIAMEMDMVIA
jgi:hypothetical protein